MSNYDVAKNVSLFLVLFVKQQLQRAVAIDSDDLREQEALVIGYEGSNQNTAGDLLGQGLELAVPSSSAAGNHKFNFDKVFGPASQQVRQ